MVDSATGQVWSSGDAYESYVGRWSRKVAEHFVAWVGVPNGSRWLDVGCGTGALSQTILDQGAPESVSGVDPSEAFVEHARAQVRGGRSSFQVGDAMRLPFSNDRFDACVSGLVLNFVPDPVVAVQEMRRVLRAGGVAGAYVWDYAGEMQMMRHFWTAAAELDNSAGALDEGVRFPVCKPEELKRCYREAGLTDIEVSHIDIETWFKDFDAFWQPFLGGQAPAPSYLASLDGKRQNMLRERVRLGLPIASDGSITLIARALTVKGRNSRA